jgi:hypothetical protein
MHTGFQNWMLRMNVLLEWLCVFKGRREREWGEGEKRVMGRGRGGKGKKKRKWIFFTKFMLLELVYA